MNKKDTNLKKIKGFYFDYFMFKEGEKPIYGSWPNTPVFSVSVFKTSEEAIKKQENIEKTSMDYFKKYFVSLFEKTVSDNSLI